MSLLCDSQVVRGLGANARKNFSAWAIGRLPMSDWKIFLEENSGTYVTKEQLQELYDRAVSDKYGFLFYRPRSRDVNNMFYRGFTTRMIPS